MAVFAVIVGSSGIPASRFYRTRAIKIVCGLAGYFVDSKKIKDGPSSDDEPLDRMLETMKSRGPDSRAKFIADDVPLVMGHNRLSIIDVDPRSNQPFQSKDGRYTLVFNGEIYNYRELRIELMRRGYEFSTSGDTEVLLYYLIEFGTNKLANLRGMYAFAMWDSSQKKLIIARDPYGIKPLYYAHNSGDLIFASQVKAILASGLIETIKNKDSEVGFWLLGSVDSNETWWSGIDQLPPGCYGIFSISDTSFEIESFWDLRTIWFGSRKNIQHRDIEGIVRAALRESVELHLDSDVSIGVFLSGGIDSSALMGLISDIGKKDVIGITVSFDEFVKSENDEFPVAREVAEYYGIKHVNRVVSKSEFLDDLPRIIESMDQPSIDGINTWYASKAASENGLKVVLSGIGGDELFLGYPSFRQLPRLVKIFRFLSYFKFLYPIMDAIFELIARCTNVSRWRFVPKWLTRVDTAWWLRRSFNSPCDLPKIMDTGHINSLKGELSSIPEEKLRKAFGDLPKNNISTLSMLESLMYLRNQLLKDSDWAGMAHSVEVRTPFVDAHLASKLVPLIPYFEKWPGKRLLALAPTKRVPSFVMNRRKTGFSIPVNQWITGFDSHNDFGRIKWAKIVVEKYDGG